MLMRPTGDLTLTEIVNLFRLRNMFEGDETIISKKHFFFQNYDT